MIHTAPRAPRPVILPVPAFTQGAPEPVLLLSGLWKFKSGAFSPELLATDFSAWADVEIPCHISRERCPDGSFCGKYAFKKQITVPSCEEGTRLFLRFEGVNGFAKVFVDGTLAGEHQNAFLTWNCEVTDLVTPGQPAVITVAVDECDPVSTFNHGGLLHDVKLIAVPASPLSRLHCETTFDADYKSAVLRVLLGADCKPGASCKVELRLLGPDGQDTGAAFPTVGFDAATERKEIEISVEAPVKWDAEHPNLYTLEAKVFENGVHTETCARKFGFRQIDLRGNQMYVNGQEIKLRGACRHEVTPLNGRAVPRALAEKDVLLFKEANCNYIRTSHYPPSEAFLEYCDQYGMYVEDEMALAFIARTLDYTQQDPAHAERYLSHYAELAERDRSHPSVVIWSLCNESFGGRNFDLLNRFAHRDDPTRPTKFSYPMTMQEEHEPVNIWSIHYSNLDTDLSAKLDNVSVGGAPGHDAPVLHDEYAHIPCYNRDEHKRDPYVRHFWGESLKRFWDKIWNTPGALGGAIWAGIDESDILYGGNTALEWGIIDLWRRPKPEFFMTRKAYSPIHIPCETLPGQAPYELTVENRFCHTDFSELDITWKTETEQGRVEMGLPIRQSGKLALPLQNVKPGDRVRLTFAGKDGWVHDAFELTVGSPALAQVSKPCGTAPTISEDAKCITLCGADFELCFDKKAGQLTSATRNGQLLLKGGPCLNLYGLRLGRWTADSVTVCLENGQAVVEIKGGYENGVKVAFTILVDGAGRMETHYRLDAVPVEMPRAVKIRVGVDRGGLDELGVYYLADGALDTLSWDRKGLWTAYAEDHIGREHGVCHKSNGGADLPPMEAPVIPWSRDMKSYLLYGRYDIPVKGTNDFRSSKEHFHRASLYKGGGSAVLRAESCGTDSLRLELAPDASVMTGGDNPAVRYVGKWYAVEEPEAWTGTELWSNDPGSYAEFEFNGTGAAWIASTDVLCGMAAVYVDGNLMDSAINLRVNGVEFPGASAGFDKRCGIPAYSVSGLPDGPHTLRVEVTGKKASDASDCYVIVDAFRVLGKGNDDVKVFINSQINFPRISWGNYSKEPILVKAGDEGSCVLVLSES